MRFEHFQSRVRFEGSRGTDDSKDPAREGRPDQHDGLKGPERFEPPEQKESPKLIPLESRRRRGILKDPYRLGLALQICLTLLLISLLIYCLFPFFAMMDRLDIPIGRVIYIPIAIVVIVLFFARRAVKLIRKFREEQP